MGPGSQREKAWVLPVRGTGELPRVPRNATHQAPQPGAFLSWPGGCSQRPRGQQGRAPPSGSGQELPAAQLPVVLASSPLVSASGSLQVSQFPCTQAVPALSPELAPQLGALALPQP